MKSVQIKEKIDTRMKVMPYRVPCRSNKRNKYNDPLVALPGSR